MELEVGQASLVVSSKASTTALIEFEIVDLKENVEVLGRACDTNVMREATSDFLHVETALASVVMLTDNFHSLKEVVETISQSHLGKGEISGVTDRKKRADSCVHLSFSIRRLEKF